jgi:hypothetical protein
METPILDKIITLAQVEMAKSLGKVDVFILLGIKTWYKMDLEILCTPIIGLLKGPAIGKPWTILLYQDCTVNVFGTAQMEEEIIQIFAPISTHQIQKPNGEETNTLP